MNKRGFVLLIVLIFTLTSVFIGTTISLVSNVKNLNEENQELKDEVYQLDKDNKSRDQQLEILQNDYDSLFKKHQECQQWRDLGEFKITCYWKGEDQWGATTKSGTQAQVNHTIAVDPSVIPLGSKIKIGNTVYTAEDIGVGVKGNVIDVWVEHDTKSFGRKFEKIYILEEK